MSASEHPRFSTLHVGFEQRNFWPTPFSKKTVDRGHHDRNASRPKLVVTRVHWINLEQTVACDVRSSYPNSLDHRSKSSSRHPPLKSCIVDSLRFDREYLSAVSDPGRER